MLVLFQSFQFPKKVLSQNYKLTGKLPEDDISGKIERSWVSRLEEKKITGTLICEDKGIEKEKLPKKYRPIADVISRA